MVVLRHHQEVIFCRYRKESVLPFIMENFYEYIIPVARNFLKRLIAINKIRLLLLYCKHVFSKKLIYSANNVLKLTISVIDCPTEYRSLLCIFNLVSKFTNLCQYNDSRVLQQC